MQAPQTRVHATQPPSSAAPLFLHYSLLLGIVFVGGWFFYTATVAEDGRSEITGWLDPFLAGATLTLHLLAIAALIQAWPRDSDAKRRLAGRRAGQRRPSSPRWPTLWTPTCSRPPGRACGSWRTMRSGSTTSTCLRARPAG